MPEFFEPHQKLTKKERTAVEPDGSRTVRSVFLYTIFTPKRRGDV